MAANVARKLLLRHLEGAAELPPPGEEIALRIAQTLTQDATGTLVMLALEAAGAGSVATELSAQYVDHNLLQEDFKNADDHAFLRSACQRFGIWYSAPGGGVSHPVHMQRFGRPGASLLGSDSHTCAAGGLGMLAIGAGGIEVVAAMLGHPFHLRMPEIWGVRLRGKLPDRVSAKDVILEMLRRHGVAAGRGRIVEYHGDGLEGLSAMDRHVIANMGAELGATTTVFPSDSETRRFLAGQGREEDWEELVADRGASYDLEDEIDLPGLEPLIARPSSPGNVVAVREVAGEPIRQAYIGSSANPGLRDFAVVAHIVSHSGPVAPGVSLDVNPTSRQLLLQLIRRGDLDKLVAAGARLHQAGCNGCIGMGQAPASGGANSLRTVPRNFPGRSGTREDAVWLCSPETAAASAVRGVITDPRTLDDIPPLEVPDDQSVAAAGPEPPPVERAGDVELVRGPNIVPLPELDALPARLEVPVVLKVGDDLSTDEILPAGARVLPFRSNIPKIAEFCFEAVDADYVARARDAGSHAIVAGHNYGQGSSREHAVLAPRVLGLRLVVARSFARIHWQNLIAYGVLPLVVDDACDIPTGSVLRVDIGEALDGRTEIEVEGYGTMRARHDLSSRQKEILRAGGMINWMRAAA